MLEYTADVEITRKQCAWCNEPAVSTCPKCCSVGFCASPTCLREAGEIHASERRCAYMCAEAALHEMAAKRGPVVVPSHPDAGVLLATEDPFEALLILEGMRRAKTRQASWFPAVWAAFRFGGAPMTVACQILLSSGNIRAAAAAAADLPTVMEECVMVVIAHGTMQSGAMHHTSNMVTAARYAIMVLAELEPLLHIPLPPLTYLITQPLAIALASEVRADGGPNDTARIVSGMRLLATSYQAIPPSVSDESTATLVMYVFKTFIMSPHGEAAERHDVTAIFAEKVVRQAHAVSPACILECLPNILCGLRSSANMDALASVFEPGGEGVVPCLLNVMDEAAACCHAKAGRLLAKLAPRFAPSDIAAISERLRRAAPPCLLSAVAEMGDAICEKGPPTTIDAFGILMAQTVAVRGSEATANLVARASPSTLYAIAREVLRSAGDCPPRLAAALSARAPLETLKDRCARCDSRGEQNLKVCTRCRVARYCNKEHQRADWPRHRGDCKRWSSTIN